MKRAIIIYSLILWATTLFSQYSSIDTVYFVNDQIDRIIYTLKNDSICIVEQYYFQYDKFENGTFYMGDVKPNEIESISTYVIRGDVQFQIGPATYFFRDGHTKTKAIYYDNKPDKFIDQWNPNKYQILKNGNGVYYQKYMNRATEFGPDSTVYQIVDSLKNGNYSIWCPKSKTEYYVCERGQYLNGYEQPLRIGFYSNGKVERIYNVVNDREHGEYTEFFKNGEYKEYGIYDNGVRIGEWKEWNEDGKLLSIVNYELGTLYGNYREFYDNGALKLSGFYEFTSGQDTIITFDIYTFEEIITIEENDRIPSRHGEWIKYNSKGEVSSIRVYNYGILKEEKTYE